jgi:tripartite-type tricarboxylate transporter receptor subunit TctC
MVASENRMKNLPQVPTAIELDMPNLTLVSPINIYGPKNLQQTIIQKIEIAIIDTLRQPETHEFFERLSAEPYFANGARILEDHKKHVLYWQRAVTAAGIQLQ